MALGFGGPSIRAVAVRAVCAVILLAPLALLLNYVRHYFFLFDDFALVELARTHSFRELLSDPLIGYFRPLPFLLLRLETFLFGWDHPAGYAAVVLAFHLANAAACAWLTSLLLPRSYATPIVLVLFVASPWATEAFLWASGIFDVMATLGVLIALAGVRLTVSHGTTPRRATTGIALAGAGALLGVFSKESAVVLPALAVVVVLTDQPVRRLGSRPTRLALVACTVPALLYLIVRANVLGVLAGAYGEFGALWGSQASIVANIWSYVRAIVWTPLPPEWLPDPHKLRHTREVTAFVVLPLMLLIQAFRPRQPRVAALCAVAFLIATLPVCWFGLSPDSTVAGRYAYLPGVWGAILIGAAVAAIAEILTPPAAALSSLMLIYGGLSLSYQVDVWTRACQMSRDVLAQLEPYRGRRDVALSIENMPFMFVEGPYVLKAYAFRFYRDDRESPLPPVKALAFTVKFAWNSQTVATAGIDPSSDYLDRPPAGRTEQSIRLKLTTP
jgi:hypothetical protein